MLRGEDAGGGSIYQSLTLSLSEELRLARGRANFVGREVLRLRMAKQMEAQPLLIATHPSPEKGEGWGNHLH
jgi:hypothetical protein